ncbi:hypothetical protein AVO45_18680 [Ruegeria marisrubri]|uniref:Carbon monoxide dehydrogenase n=1 Tax=Ruegeria marisrubri TaxID=1685379 RepID=A0A0X3U519_9RHOB|nr:SRPBCC domain-containing protein [Ruegeria marisrubri]KUJ83203.1 hypothetical protein AVO45_18680 [Ruegeria marisrubri]
MELELTHTFDTTPEQLWEVLLNPHLMAACVPGMQSVEVLSDTEYRATIKVKIAFINAKFDIYTHITETEPPKRLRCEAKGEDNSVGSAVESVAEMTLNKIDHGQTELRVTTKTTIFGRLGTLGLNPMRTKAKSMWKQFCTELAAVLAGEKTVEAPSPSDAKQPPEKVGKIDVQSATDGAATASRPPSEPDTESRGILGRLRRKWSGGENETHLEFRQGDAVIVLHCPASQTQTCLDWLDQQLARQQSAQ